MMTTSTTPQSGDLLTIHLDGKPYAVPLAIVLDVCRSLPVTPIPGAPPHVLGVAAWRGRLIPCIGLHHLGAASGLTVPRQFLIVVVRLSQGEAGLEVEAPVEVMTQSVTPSSSGQPEQPGDAAAPAMPLPLLDLERLVPRYDDRGRPGAPSSP